MPNKVIDWFLWNWATTTFLLMTLVVVVIPIAVSPLLNWAMGGGSWWYW